jgi:hypothetical protein
MFDGLGGKRVEHPEYDGGEALCPALNSIMEGE